MTLAAMTALTVAFQAVPGRLQALPLDFPGGAEKGVMVCSCCSHGCLGRYPQFRPPPLLLFSLFPLLSSLAAITAAEFSPNSGLCAAGTSSGVLSVFDVQAKVELCCVPAHMDCITGM